MAEPVVSVVIPLYNARDVIRETLEGLFAQTYPHFEVIVVDDGSTDGSGEVVQGYGDRVRYMFQRNAGVACARNRGIAAARGKYIALLDHDDLWGREKLAKQVSLLDSQPSVGMVVTDSRMTVISSHTFQK